MLDHLVAVIMRRARTFSVLWLSIIGTFWKYKQFSSRNLGRKLDIFLNEKEQNYMQRLNKYGVCIIEGFWSEQTCQLARAEVDRIVKQYPEALHNAAKSDLRVYGANNVSDLIDTFAQNKTLRKIATVYNCEETKAAFTLAAKMPASSENQGSGEGWHRDAFFRQFKAILYISDVSLENGPFQLISNSHSPRQVLRDIWAGGLRYMQNRLSEDEIARILKKNPERLITYTAKQGTLILVDTSSIHRGMPIEIGTRYALTNYYFPERNIDEALFEKFKVLSTPPNLS